MNANGDRVTGGGSGAGGTSGGSARSGGEGTIGEKSGAAFSRVSEAAERIGDKAREAAGSAGAQAQDQARRFADSQVRTSADMVAKVGESVRVAADHLQPDLPQLAQVAQVAADWIDDYSEALRERSAGELMEGSAEFARRHPAMVFAAAAGTGFVLFRLLNADSGRRSARAGFEEGGARPGGQMHGV